MEAVSMRRAVLAMAAAAVLAAGAAAAQTAVAVEDARRLAVALADQGRSEEAAEVAGALLARNPEDAAAWVVLARVRRGAGDAPGALEAAERANAAAATDDERYAASIEIAAANFVLERRLVAQFWLRRAAEVAPSEALRAAAIRNFRQVRAQTPWQFSFNLSVVPSSNVNNGSREEVIEIAGLPFVLSGDARALSGIEISAGASARYRFAGVNDLPAQLTFALALQRVRLSDDGRAQAPDAEGSDYAYDAVEFGYGQVLSGRDNEAVWRLDTLVGRNWYGGEPLSNYARVGASVQWPTGERAATAVSASVERQVRFDRDDRSAWVGRLDLRQVWQTEDGGRLGVSGGVRRTASDSAEIDHRAVTAGVDYRFGEPVFAGATLDMGLSLERRVYDASPFSVDGREDNRARVAATLGFPELDYYGFSPTVTFEAQRVDSNISLYQTDDYAVRVGIRSVF